MSAVPFVGDWIRQVASDFRANGSLLIFMALMGVIWELQQIRELLGGIRHLSDEYQRRIDDADIEQTLRGGWPPTSS